MNVCLIGCGGISELHMRVYKRMKNVNVVGVCDLNEEKMQNIARRFGIKKVFTDYKDLFEIKDLDFIDICTPVNTHSQIVCDAAKHVPAIFLEKPMGLNVLECDKMIAEVKKHRS